MFISRKDYHRLEKDRRIRTLNKGSQTLAYLCQSDIVIFVGERGTGKTHLMLNKALPYINSKGYNAVYFRKEYGDFEKAGGMVDASKKVFSQYGDYLSSFKRWDFNSGAKVEFMNYSDPLKDFLENIQGKEFTHVFIDEITHIDQPHFNAIFANLRNTTGIKTQLVGACNPDSSSWIKDLIRKYLDINIEQHTARHSKALRGRELYFYQYGDDIKESVWGLTKEEVYQNRKEDLDNKWNDMLERRPDLADFGSIYDLILSISVFDSSKVENEHLMANGGIKYQAKLLMQSREMRNRFAISDWEETVDVKGLLSSEDMENFFYNTEQRSDSGERFASMDVGAEGNDKTVIYIWDGLHIDNIYVTKGLKATDLILWTKNILAQEHIPYSNFVYDSGGVGFAFSGHFDEAFKFLSQAKQEEILDNEGNPIRVYANLKSQTVGCFLKYIKASDLNQSCAISINRNLLDMDIYGQTLRQHLMNERKCICWTSKKDGILQTINKEETKALVGHSADIMLAMVYRFVFLLEEMNNTYAPPTQQTLNNLAYFLFT